MVIHVGCGNAGASGLKELCFVLAILIFFMLKKSLQRGGFNYLLKSSENIL